MRLEKIVENRRSVREYKDKAIDNALIQDLFEDMKSKRKLVADIGVELYFIENGETAYRELEGIVGYFGKVIKAPHYIAISSETKDGYLENSGYLGEKLALKATEMELGTCWIEVPEGDSKVKEILRIDDKNVLVGLLAIGYPKNETRVAIKHESTIMNSLFALAELGYPRMNLEYSTQPVSSRQSIDEIVYLKEWGNKADIKELEDRGIAEPLFYMRLAPSWGNRQPWKFILDEDKMILVVRNDETSINEKVAKIEGGIAMLYFELMMHNNGIPGGWKLEKIDKDYNIPENYFMVGYYTI